MRRPTVYVAGPYTKPDPCINTNIAIQIANQLFDAGFAPFIPHLSHFWHTVTPRPYEDWMTLDFEWVERSDALLRLPGESSGADREVELALAKGIPVYYSVDDVIANLHDAQANELRTLRELVKKLSDENNENLIVSPGPLYYAGWAAAWQSARNEISDALEALKAPAELITTRRAHDPVMDQITEDYSHAGPLF